MALFQKPWPSEPDPGFQRPGTARPGWAAAARRIFEVVAAVAMIALFLLGAVALGNAPPRNRKGAQIPSGR